MNNKLKCWGRNNYGQLGYGHAEYSIGDNPGEMGNNLTEIDLGNNFTLKQVSAGYSHSCAISDIDTIKCWGRNDYGELGYGDINDRYSAYNLSEVYFGNDLKFQKLLPHEHGIHVHYPKQHIKCWGRNNYGQVMEITNKRR